MTASNPEIIDLAAWQQVTSDIQEVKDRLDNITTNYGATTVGTGEWNVSATNTHEFNLGTQKLVTGRYKYVVADEGTSGKFKYGPIEFGTAFSGSPIVTATIQFGGNTVRTSNANIVLTIYDVKVDGFAVRLTNAGTTTDLSGYFYINWMAVGPK